MKIGDYLEPGLENRITAKELQAATGLSETKLRRLIHEARLNGDYIASSNETGRNGYFLISNLSEARAFDKFLEGTAASYEELRPTFQKAIKEFTEKEGAQC